jgi:hypothetical protein
METCIQRLNARHYKIVDLLVLGWTNKQIGDHLHMSPSQVSIIINSASTQHQVARRRAKMEQRLDTNAVESTQTVDDAIKSHTLKAVARLGLIITDGKEANAVRACSDILDRGGYPRVQKTESRNVTLTIDAGDAALIAETMQMCDGPASGA